MPCLFDPPLSVPIPEVLSGAIPLIGPLKYPFYRVAIIAEADNPGLRQLCHVCKLLTVASQRDRANRQHAHGSKLRRQLQHRRNDIRVVLARVGVGHGADGRITTARSGHRAGLNRLFVLFTRLPKVRVNVNESRRHHLVSSIYNIVPVRRLRERPGRDLHDLAVLDQNGCESVDILRRVNHPATDDCDAF